MVDTVFAGQAGSGVCVVRPPGHHADRQTPCGFCLINNVAIAAKHATKLGKRVLILDWDVHHGNGTQNITLDSDQVSLHMLLLS